MKADILDRARRHGVSVGPVRAEYRPVLDAYKRFGPGSPELRIAIEVWRADRKTVRHPAATKPLYS